MSLAEMPWEVREVPLQRLYEAAKRWHGDVERHRNNGRPDLVRIAEYQRDRYLDLCATAVMLLGDDE